MNISITNDLVLEPREAFKIMLSLPVNSVELGVRIGEPNNAIVVILDDDSKYSCSHLIALYLFYVELNVFFRHLRFTALENSTVMSVVIEASKPAGVAFNVTVVPRIVNTSSKCV